MRSPLGALKRTVTIVAVAATLVAGGILAGQSASADTAPVSPTDPKTPVTVSDDALPTPQIDGVVWFQTIVGNTVYVGGKFTTVRPYGSAAGVNTVAQPYLFSYNLTTGVMNSAFRPALNAQVRAITAAANGNVYISGSFTTVNGTTRNRVAEINGTTGALVTAFNPNPNYVVNALALSPSGSTLYIGGGFTSVGTQNHGQVAAVNATTGAPSAAFAATALNGGVTALAVSPDGTQVVVGGNFTTLNGSNKPGYGLGAVNATTGALLPYAVNNSLIRDAGTQAGITGLATDASGVYISAYDYTGGGNYEGTIHASWSGGSLIWAEDCHGDTYSVAVTDNAEYVSGHSHVCSTVGGFPQTSPAWTYHHGIAFSKSTTQTLTASPDLVSHAGLPAPSLLNWFPTFTEGTYTGLSQATWSVAANSQYVVYGGEFPAVNGIKQQGLTRFAVPSIAPNKMGPTANVAAPTFTGVGNTTVTVNWKTVSDPDNATLTYSIYRDGGVSPIATKQVSSTFWNMPAASWTDTTASSGATHTYRVAVSDPFGNGQAGATASVKTTGTAGTTPPVTTPPVTTAGYSATVAAQGASDYWRLDQATGTTAADSRGSLPLTLQAGVTSGTAGGTGDGDKASTFNGTATGSAATSSAVVAPNTFSIASWFKTTTTAGGKIVGFGDAATGTSGKFDRQVYMNADGTLTYGIRTAGVNTPLNSTAKYNDGAWHEVVATTGSGGSALYVDGKLVTTNTTATSGQANTGYWRIGGDRTWGTPIWFSGAIDDVSIYPAVLTPTQVAAQWTAAGH